MIPAVGAHHDRDVTIVSPALGIAIMSYNGRIDFGLVADYDALPDLRDLATHLEAAIGELADVAGAAPVSAPRAAARVTQRA